MQTPFDAIPLSLIQLTGSATFLCASDTHGAEVEPVTAETFTHAKVDARNLLFIEAGDMNRGLVYDVPTPVDYQAVPRMNRDTLYAGIPIDTSEGFTITLAEAPEGRYRSCESMSAGEYKLPELAATD